MSSRRTVHSAGRRARISAGHRRSLTPRHRVCAGGQAASRDDAAVYGDVRRAGHRDHARLQPGDRRKAAASSVGATIEFFTVDDESEPAEGNRQREQARSTRQGRRARRNGPFGRCDGDGQGRHATTSTLLLIPNAGANAATGGQCAPNVFRTSFSNWQPAHPMGKVMYDRGHRKVVTLTWKYGAGEESIEQLQGGVHQARRLDRQGNVPAVSECRVPAVHHRDRVAQARRGVRFLRRWRRGEVHQGLCRGRASRTRSRSTATGFLTDGTLEAQGAVGAGTC